MMSMMAERTLSLLPSSPSARDMQTPEINGMGPRGVKDCRETAEAGTQARRQAVEEKASMRSGCSFFHNLILQYILVIAKCTNGMYTACDLYMRGPDPM